MHYATTSDLSRRHWLGALALLLAAAGTAHAQRPATFGTATTAGTGSGSSPYAVAVADVNGDGRPDLLTANAFSNSVGVLLGAGAGSFGPVTTYSTGSGSSPQGLAVADVNGDGKLDVLTANYHSNSAGVLLGTGTGSFGAVSTYGTGTNSLPYALAVADVNGDGKLDILTANYGTSAAGVLLGTGTGSFGPVTAYGTGSGSQPQSLAVADVNGDGDLDLLTANTGTSTAGVLLGTGTGSFGTVTTYGTGSNSQPAGIAVADVNGDGRPDVLTANKGTSTAGVLLGTGVGSFGAASTYGTGGSPYGLAVADVNGDGDLDLLAADANGNTAGVLLGTGTGAFGAASTYGTGGGGSQPAGLAVADVNGDGRPDLLTANTGTSTAGVLLNTTPMLATRTFLPVSTYSAGSGSLPQGIAVADVNGDGKPDLLTANPGTSTAGVLLGTGTGSFGPVTTYGTGSGSGPYAIAVADVNGDGKPDLLTANTGTSTAGVLLGTGTGSFGAVTNYDAGTNSQPYGIAVADVNGDGKLDLLTANFGSGTAGVLLGTGTGTFGSATIYDTGSQPSGIAVADVNGDGKPDLLTANYINGTAGVLLGTGAGTFGAVSTYGTGTNSSPYAIAVADVNGDGKPDLLTANRSTRTAGVLLGTGTGTFGAVTAYGTGTNNSPYAIAVADVNGDGKLDLLTANFGSGTAGVLLGTGTGTFGSATTYGTGSQPSGIAVADVNGDGKPDLLTANYINGTAGVLLGGLDLVVSTAMPVYADALYNSIAVQSGGTATLAANVALAGSGGTTVQNGGTLHDGCFVLSGPGSFTLEAGGTLGICQAAGISSSGSTGSIQVTGQRSFSPDARYTYQGTAAQLTGTGLPASVRTLTLTNGAGLTLTNSLTTTAAATLQGGVLTTGSNVLTLGAAAVLTEGAASYATGTVQTTRPLGTAGTLEEFGGLGLALTPGGSTLPGSTLVVRTTGPARAGAGTSQSVRRVFDIQPTVKTGLSVALALTVRDDELGGIAPNNLRLFKSEDGGSSWRQQAGATFTSTNAVNGQPATYTARLGGISSFSLWTLGDAANPLPVELVQFAAQRQGAAAVLLTWATASETNSARFEVERSLDGGSFDLIGQVAAAGTSVAARTYRLLDAALPASAPVLYYRLRQVDQDGTFAYSPVRVVVGAGATGLAVWPNPVGAGQPLSCSLGTTAPGQHLRLTLRDATGRLVATLTAANSQPLPLPALPAGLYLAEVQAADGTRASCRLVLE